MFKKLRLFTHTIIQLWDRLTVTDGPSESLSYERPLDTAPEPEHGRPEPQYTTAVTFSGEVLKVLNYRDVPRASYPRIEQVGAWNRFTDEYDKLRNNVAERSTWDKDYKKDVPKQIPVTQKKIW